jgi:hypothetical protein
VWKGELSDRYHPAVLSGIVAAVYPDNVISVL